MEPFLADPDFISYVGDASAVLAELPAEIADAVMTSVPFFGLRDYGTGRWEGGDASCDHLRPMPGGIGKSSLASYENGLDEATTAKKVTKKQQQQQQQQFSRRCEKCGALRFDDQIGLEETPEEWAFRLVEVFEEVRRVLRPSGCVLIEIGDSYGANRRGGKEELPDGYRVPPSWRGGNATPITHPSKDKDLIGQPFLLAFALRAAGWYWRGTYIWSKPNPMPESVSDRCTTAHSYVLHMTKASRYFWDDIAIEEPASLDSHPRGRGSSPKAEAEAEATGRHRGFGAATTEILPTRNARSVWTIPTEPSGMGICPACRTYWHRNSPEKHCGVDVVQHFAAFPVALAEKAIRAATSEHGVCSSCGSPWTRIVEKGEPELAANTWSSNGAADQAEDPGPRSTLKHVRTSETVGWEPTCSCGTDAVPAVVLDPFMGSGTTALAARRLGRHAIGVELNEHYAEMAARRLAQQSLFAEA